MYDKMSKITIFTSEENLDLLLQTMWQMNCIHLLKVTNDGLEDVHQPQYKKDEIEFHQNYLKDLGSFFKIYSSYVTKSTDIAQVSLQQSKALLLKLKEQVDRWKLDMSAIDKKQVIYDQYQDILTQFQGIIPTIDPDSVLEVRGIIIRDPVPNFEYTFHEYLEKELGDLFELEIVKVSSNLLLGSIVYPKEYTSRIRSILDSASISDLVLPSKLEAESLGAKIQQLLNETKAIKIQKEELFKNLQFLYDNFMRLQAYSEFIQQEAARAEGLTFIKKSNNFLIVSGYVPYKDKNSITTLFENKFGNDNFTVHFEDDIKETPTKFNNPHFVKEFQIFTEMLPPLKTNTIDPTWLIFLFFPLFYGFIVGDIGYGIIISLIGYLVYKKSQKNNSQETMKRLGWVIFVSGISTIIFGILYGEFFGNFGEHLGLHSLLFQRTDDLMGLLIISILIGIFHVSLGLTLGIYNGIKTEHKKFALRNSGLITLYASMALFTISLYFETKTNWLFIFSVISLSAGLGLVIFVEGFIGVIEALSTIGNMLSYARLMALGAASVILADLANQLYMTVGGGVGGIIVALLLHGLNIILALFSPTIHSMRLHLVEFFNKFVEFGTMEYLPFGTYKPIRYN